MPSFLNNITQLRSIAFGKQHFWDIRFPDADPPFSEWFPAADVTWGVANVVSYSTEFYLSSYDFPQSYQSNQVQITFFDDIYRTLEHWIEKWMTEDMFPGTNENEYGLYVNFLEDIARELIIQKLDFEKEPIKTDSLWVFPEGQFDFRGTSDSSPIQHSVNFKIVGRA